MISLPARLTAVFKRRFARPATADGERVYAIGDVHGRLDLFRSLIGQLESDALERRAKPARIILLGDLIDRGPGSRELLDLVKRMQLQNAGRVVVLCGNHEQMLLASAEGHGDAQRLWVENGGDATLESYGLSPAEFMALSPGRRSALLRTILGADMLAWIGSLPLTYRSGDYFFCHAGVRPKVPLQKQRREDLLWIRREFLDSDRSHGAVIVHGHSETDAVEVRHNRINVDTCAYQSGQLTAIGLEGPYKWFISTKERCLNRADLEAALKARSTAPVGSLR